MKPLTHASLFSGIGGFDLAAEWAGWTNLFNCEKDPFCQRVLKYHFPDAIQYSDIRDTDFTIWRGRIDILTGGFPCQPFSHAGKRKGAEDDRYLWPEMLRAISEIRPAWVIGENVGGIVSMVQPGSEIEVDAQATLLGENYTETETAQDFVVETICQDLERIGYSVQPVLIPACGVGAPHRRDRVWFIAFMENAGSVGQHGPGVLHQQPGGASIIGTGEVGLSGVRKELEDAAFELAKDTQRVRRDSDQPEPSGAATERVAADTNGQLSQCRNDKGANGWDQQEIPTQSLSLPKDWQNFPTQSPVCGGNDGFPAGLDGITFPKWRSESIKAYGNAIVPQVAYQIFKAINECEQL